MKKTYNGGVYPTMITPYRADGSVDLDTAEKYVRWYFDKGCHGIFSICQSSETFHLTLDERIALNKRVYETAKQLERESGRTFTIVTSGHIAESVEEQAYDMQKIYESGSDAMIFMTNRLDLKNEGDDVWLRNADKLLSLIPDDIMLGMYEVPYPYKRLVTPRILNWCKETGRFRFMKDTCCDIDMIKERLDILRGSEFMLMNANAQTLLESFRYGASGYSSIMANFHPELYVWLYENYEKEPEKADMLQNFLGTVAFVEQGLPYPLIAKYHMCLEGIPTENISRVKDSSLLTPYAKECVRQMRELAISYRELLKI
ncbi:MAG: dihydrodipicolinate synthase family protein [Clostridia bacterium]|nr:dihydrodipicolinate synthase family protein [Clostridia bacterium]